MLEILRDLHELSVPNIRQTPDTNPVGGVVDGLGLKILGAVQGPGE